MTTTANRPRAAAIAAGLAMLVGTAATASESSFDAGAEGWTILDLSCSSDAVLDEYPIEWAADGGDPGGHVFATDPTDNCSVFSAPAAFLGDQSAFAGGRLVFSLRTTVSDWPPGRFVLLQAGDGTRLAGEMPEPTDSWQEMVLRFDGATWAFDVVGGTPASAAEVAAVLADLVVLRISAEHGAQQGQETTFLDSVRYETGCLEDLGGDGAVGFDDLLAVLAAFDAACDPCPEDVDGNGTVDFADVLAVLSAWGPCG